jgi:hypothetical protein
MFSVDGPHVKMLNFVRVVGSNKLSEIRVDLFERIYFEMTEELGVTTRCSVPSRPNHEAMGPPVSIERLRPKRVRRCACGAIMPEDL